MLERQVLDKQFPKTDGIRQDIPDATEVRMSQAIVGKWGKNLAIRLPAEIARASGLTDGERVEIEAHDGDILIRRPAAHARADAQAAAEEIIGESGCYSLGDLTIRDLLDEGRRG